ncbi:hypothetical protein BDU57DRAFT_519853 [Ampelomyces quisqualis]|uniref:Uncharacterized protein n=1 Tax=Ampelomyces quisqualis TaxID=50730 RepID=A0A6A5QGR5_AMPQU|nr:hypothetical protein BDU57DRAFT_519853 [Ampelomyces quisqualis]
MWYGISNFWTKVLVLRSFGPPLQQHRHTPTSPLEHGANGSGIALGHWLGRRRFRLLVAMAIVGRQKSTKISLLRTSSSTTNVIICRHFHRETGVFLRRALEVQHGGGWRDGWRVERRGVRWHNVRLPPLTDLLMTRCGNHLAISSLRCRLFLHKRPAPS